MLIGVKDSEGDDCSGVRADCVSRLFVGSLAIIESASTPKTTFEDLRDASYAVDVEYAAALLSGPALTLPTTLISVGGLSWGDSL